MGAWPDFDPVDVGADQVTRAATVQPQLGCPWRVRIETSFTLAADGLTQRVTATNLGTTPAPVGLGPHPHLRAGWEPLDDRALELPADPVLDVDARLAPLSVIPVDSDAYRFDFRRHHRIGDVEIDHAYTGLARDAQGIATVSLTTRDGAGVRIDDDTACEWVQIHTADLPGGPHGPGSDAVWPSSR